MNIDHTEPTLFDVKFVGSDGCVYGSKWSLAMTSDVLHTIFTETKQDEDDNMFTIEEKDYTQDQLNLWLSFAHSCDASNYFIDGLDHKSTARMYVSSVLLCRKYNMPELEDEAFTWIMRNQKDCYLEVCHQLNKNNVFDTLIPVWTSITLFGLSDEQLHEVPKDVLLMFMMKNKKTRNHVGNKKYDKPGVKPYFLLQEKPPKDAPKDVLIMFILKNRKFVLENRKFVIENRKNNYNTVRYSNKMYWWVSFFAHGDEYIKSYYTEYDVERARASLLSENPAFINKDGYDKMHVIGLYIWKQFSEAKKKDILKPAFDEWKLLAGW
jgi:hypothetical protein